MTLASNMLEKSTLIIFAKFSSNTTQYMRIEQGGSFPT